MLKKLWIVVFVGLFLSPAALAVETGEQRDWSRISEFAAGLKCQKQEGASRKSGNEPISNEHQGSSQSSTKKAI